MLKQKKREKKTSQCKICGKEFTTICGKYCEVCLSEVQRKAGCKAAASRKVIRRSKNEIYFAELCIAEFKNVSTNEPIFDGWDADVLLNDYKIAVHWNGPWHYQDCGGKHSFKQTQARDKIKHDSIVRNGWVNYIIKDLGKYNKQLVDGEFFKLKEYILGKNNNDT